MNLLNLVKIFILLH